MISFRINNIKAFVDSGKIELAPITIFVGKNSCGKSSLIRFPAVLAQSRMEDSESPISFFGKLLDYGNYEDVIHGHEQMDFTYSVEYEINTSNLSNVYYPVRNVLHYNRSSRKNKNLKSIISVTIGKTGKKIVIKGMKFYLDDLLAYEIVLKQESYTYILYCKYENNQLIKLEHFYTFQAGLEISNRFNAGIPIVFVDEDQIARVIDDEFGKKGSKTTEKFLESRRSYRLTEEVLNDYNSADRAAIQIESTIEFLTNLTIQIARSMEFESSSLSYIGPFRQSPDRYYRDMERNANFVGARGENVSTILVNDFHKKKELIKQISLWLNEALGYKLAIKDMGANLFQVMLEDDKGFQSNIMDVGYGVSQILPIVVAVFKDLQRPNGYIGADSILIIEQPELHLHPAAQAELANLFAECIVGTKGERRSNRKKILIETHSEHLIRKLQVLIAEKRLNSEMVKFYYVDKNEEGEASVNEMRILPNGKFIDRWPSGFFDKAQILAYELLRSSGRKLEDW